MENTNTISVNPFAKTSGKGKDIKETAVVGITQIAVILIIAILVVILGIIIYQGRDKFSWEFISSFPTDGMTKGGIFPALIGTFILVIVMSIAAVPFGTITAIYLTEYAKENSKFAAAVRFSIRTLAVVPSIIFGLFGLGFFIQFVGTGMDTAFNGGELHWGQPNILWASLTMALLTLPVIIVSVEEALKTIPRELREASLALGATKWQTIKKVVFPGSISGIMTGTILAVSRGAGEVAPILFYRSSLLFGDFTRIFERPIYEFGVSRLHYVDPIFGCGENNAHSVCNHIGIINSNFILKFSCSNYPIQN